MGQSEKMEQEDNRPKWLTELENRKRKPRLAHEVGAGAPCMKCSTACPGLDLHFWRKICKNCKCSRDDHDVPNDEFPQFDLLFGPSGKANRKMIVLKVNKKQAEAEMTFEWAPPDTTKELAADYMKALPEDKLPIKGTAGAALRKQQLQRQLPLHDIDHKVCDELSESERKQFEKYLENLKKYVGQGKVTKAMGARPFDISLMTPANATDMNRFSPKHKPSAPETGHSLNLRTPSSFVQKSHFPSSIPGSEVVNGIRNRGTDSPARDQSPSSAARLENIRSAASETSSSENSPQGRYHRALANVRNDGEISNSKPVGVARNPPIHFATTNKIPDSAYATIGGSSESANSRLESSRDWRNADLASSDRVGGNRNAAVQFAAANMLEDSDRMISEHCGDDVNGSARVDEKNRGLNFATSSTLTNQDQLAFPVDSKLYSSRNPDGNLAASSSVAGSYNSARDDREAEESSRVNSELVKNRDQENSRLAERMLNEALLPPSAIHAADIIGSTLDEKGLSFIRDKLTSKYSAKDESVSLSGAARSRELGVHERKDQNPNGAKSKRADQLRRQGAFDKETDRSDVIAATRNPSGNRNSDEELPSENHDEANSSSSRFSDLEEPVSADSQVAPSGFCDSKDNHFPGGRAFKDDIGNEPWRQIYRGICDNYLAKPGGENPGDREIHQGRNNSSIDKDTSIDRPIGSGILDKNPTGQALRAELSSYGPGNSSVVRSENQHNQIFPEEAIVSSGIVQNPVSVDRLRGAMEEMSVNHGKTQNCHHCQEAIRPGDVVVTAEKADDSVWHPGCFVCTVCNELLADLVYFYYKGKLYCGRDLATLLDIPRCFACDELIFVREYTVAEGHNYHVKHFCCWDCDVPLAGQQYISENDRPLCLPCYQRAYAKTCGTCGEVIAADQQGVAVKNLNFHAVDECFCCATCRKSLLNGKMAIKEDRPFCTKECIAKFLNERSS